MVLYLVYSRQWERLHNTGILRVNVFGNWLSPLGGGRKMYMEQAMKAVGISFTSFIGKLLGAVKLGEKDFLDLLRSFAADILNIVPSEQPLGTALFDAVSKHSIGVALEGVLFRRTVDGEIEVYMAQRSENESTYPGQIHAPGAMLRVSDVKSGNPYQAGFERLSGREYDNLLTGFTIVGECWSQSQWRTVLSKIALVEASGEPQAAKGAWYNVKSLPVDKMVDVHRDAIIPIALAVYNKEDK